MAAANSEPQPTVQTPLLSARWSLPSEPVGDLEAAYGMGTHATWVTMPKSDTKCLIDYQPLKFSSFRVCCVRRGTVADSVILLIEQLALLVVFFACAFPVYYFFKTDVSEGTEAKGDGVSVKRFVLQQEAKMRAFAMIMTGLVGFLLTFYTANVVARWWTMRTVGVGGIKAATVDLELMLYQCVTRDRELLRAVHRYGRSSLMLIFLWRRKELDNLKKIMTSHDLLTAEECDLLGKWKHCLHETLWAWQGALVHKLKVEGKIPSDRLYALLLKKVMDGRAAVQCVHTHLAVKVPMQYVHLLGLLVKMHNVVLAIIMGILFGGSCRLGKWILCCQLFARVFILPIMYNAILLINCDLSDPFSGSEADFPGEIYQQALQKDCDGMLSATDNVPDFLQLDIKDVKDRKV